MFGRSSLAVFWFCCFFFNDTATTEIYTLSLHDALPICHRRGAEAQVFHPHAEVFLVENTEQIGRAVSRNAETDIVCRLLLEKNKNKQKQEKINSNTTQRTTSSHNINSTHM